MPLNGMAVASGATPHTPAERWPTRHLMVSRTRLTTAHRMAVYPLPMRNEFNAMLKNTTLVSGIGVLHRDHGRRSLGEELAPAIR
ncbi:hypothetical protein LMG27177_02235 [Paraburkholderia fynbosensis]|uniref:Uncharacterized protein n=2 Tax=Paraburkholderia fynbosensis TaxID=1200993 RepID=A0A6J5FX35_9BURK|nr:hypothetical protein LMG27177_02235 [Paraburkholderia fynbosensis]